MFIFVFYFVCIVFQQHKYIYTLALLLLYNFFSSKVDEDTIFIMLPAMLMLIVQLEHTQTMM